MLSPPVRNVFRWASSDSTSLEADRFLQTRLAVFARLFATFFAGMYLAGVLGVAVFMPGMVVAVHLHPSKLQHLGMVLLMVGAWRYLRRGERSTEALRACDLAMVLAIAGSVSFGVARAPGGYHLEFVGIMLMIIVLVVRAAIVPSSAPWTAFVGFSGSVVVLVGGAAQVHESRYNGFATPPLIYAILIVWAFAAVAASAVVSRVIYGLVTQVHEAMRLGQYTLREKIGEGGMGAVYRAEHAMLRRPTAVKLLLPERHAGDSLSRFEREVQLTSRLSHPNTIAVYDYGRTADGIFYYAMEYIQGKTLERIVEEEGPQRPERAVHFLRQIAGALREAHEVGLIHRDIKPSNVLVCTRGGIPEFVKVIDFGLVKQLDGGEDTTVTQVNTIAGTPLFMAPECVTRASDIDARIDVYALGGVGYFLITGVPPFGGRTVVEICGHHLHTPPTPPSERLGKPVPERLEALLLRCLEKDPAARPSDAELAVLLRECERESPWTSPPPF